MTALMDKLEKFLITIYTIKIYSNFAIWKKKCFRSTSKTNINTKRENYVFYQICMHVEFRFNIRIAKKSKVTRFCRSLITIYGEIFPILISQLGILKIKFNQIFTFLTKQIEFTFVYSKLLLHFTENWFILRKIRQD